MCIQEGSVSAEVHLASDEKEGFLQPPGIDRSPVRIRMTALNQAKLGKKQ